MKKSLRATIVQASSSGIKKINQDFYGSCTPDTLQLYTKGIATAIADGVSSSEVSQIASESAVKSFLSDYYCTSETWSIKKSVQRVLSATNSWLCAQTQNSPYRYHREKGYVCTFSALILKLGSAHLFHIGDARIYRVRAQAIECLTSDHCHEVSEHEKYLTRALGLKSTIEIEYNQLSTLVGDIFILATDGIYEHISESVMRDVLIANLATLAAVSNALIEIALENGSADNLTVQVVRVDALPIIGKDFVFERAESLPPAPLLAANTYFEGCLIVRELYCSARSHVYLAIDHESKKKVVLKVPSLSMRDDPQHLEQFLMEAWIASRINNDHVIKAVQFDREKQHIYTVLEYFEGKTLTQWMLDNPRPTIDQVRSIVSQIASALLSFCRLEMVHQDVRPDNILIDDNHLVKLIDFGSAKVAGISEFSINEQGVLGTLQYSAPEYFIGESGTHQSDVFSLGVITYQLLTQRLPYGNAISRTTTRKAQQRLQYQSVRMTDDSIPSWIDFAIKQAIQVNPLKRYVEVSEFAHDLQYPNKQFLKSTRPPLIERNPVFFWQLISLTLFLLLSVSLLGD